MYDWRDPRTHLWTAFLHYFSNAGSSANTLALFEVTNSALFKLLVCKVSDPTNHVGYWLDESLDSPSIPWPASSVERSPAEAPATFHCDKFLSWLPFLFGLVE